MISARFVSQSERITIANLVQARRGVRAVARELGQSPPTLSREIHRNIHEPSGTYKPRPPNAVPEDAGNPELREFVRGHLE